MIHSLTIQQSQGDTREIYMHYSCFTLILTKNVSMDDDENVLKVRLGDHGAKCTTLQMHQKSVTCTTLYMSEVDGTEIISQ